MILGINGSPHKDGTVARLLQLALAAVEKTSTQTKLIHLSKYPLDIFTGDYSAPPDKMEELVALIKQSDGLILVSPVHWFNVSSLMKNFLDHLTHFEYPEFPFEGKVAGFITVCEEDGGMQANLQMLAPLNHLGFMIPPYGTVFYNKKLSNLSEDEWMNKDIELLAQNMVILISKTKNTGWGY